MAACAIFMLNESVGTIANSVIESPATFVTWPTINEQITHSMAAPIRTSSFEQRFPNPFPIKVISIYKDIK